MARLVPPEGRFRVRGRSEKSNPKPNSCVIVSGMTHSTHNILTNKIYCKNEAVFRTDARLDCPFLWSGDVFDGPLAEIGREISREVSATYEFGEIVSILHANTCP